MTITWSDPDAARAQAVSMSGMERLRALAAGELPGPPVGAVLGMRLVDFAEGRVVLESEPAEHHGNLLGTVHGGILISLLDAAMSLAVQSLLPGGVPWTTLELKTNFVRPVTQETGTLTCTAHVINPGRRTVLTEGTIEDIEGRLLTHSTSTCIVLRGTPSRRPGA